jgi:hypothetical protein
MRLLLGLALGLAVLWGGYWIVGSRALDREVNAWFDMAEAEGRLVAREAVSVSGFPSRFDVTVTAPRLEDAATGWGWSTPFLQVFSMTWKPWHLIAVLAPTQEITTPGGRVIAVTSDIRASLRLRPGLDLALDQAVVDGKALSFTSEGWSMAAGRIELAAAGDATRQNGVRLGLQADDLTLDPALAALVPALGGVISDVHVDVSVQLSMPVDRHLTPEAQVTAVHLAEAHLVWGDLAVSGQGEVSRDADGRAKGEIALSVAHWQQLPEALVALGVMPGGMVPWVTRALSLLAAGATNPDRLEVPLTFANGRMALGALPLGPAPMLP